MHLALAIFPRSLLEALHIRCRPSRAGLPLGGLPLVSLLSLIQSNDVLIQHIKLWNICVVEKLIFHAFMAQDTFVLHAL